MRSLTFLIVLTLAVVVSGCNETSSRSSSSTGKTASAVKPQQEKPRPVEQYDLDSKRRQVQVALNDTKAMIDGEMAKCRECSSSDGCSN